MLSWPATQRFASSNPTRLDQADRELDPDQGDPRDDKANEEPST